MYTVIRRFQERFDSGHDYNVGDAYPRDGFMPPDGRAEALCSGGKSALNANGAVFIKVVAEVQKSNEAMIRRKPAKKKVT